jgi:TatD DNase family protein
VIAVGENLSDARQNLKLAKRFSLLRPAAGLYPKTVDLYEAEQMISFIRAHHRHLVAIGEVGLDYWIVKDAHQREIQREIFCRFIDLSLELDLPLNVHSRSAGRHAVALLLERGARRVQLHAFDGKAATAQPAAEAGFLFSIPPSILRSRQKQKLVKQLPVSSLLVETDSPVLGPSAHLRNEPASALISLKAISEIKGLRRSATAQEVFQNTLGLFGEIGTSSH